MGVTFISVYNDNKLVFTYDWNTGMTRSFDWTRDKFTVHYNNYDTSVYTRKEITGKTLIGA
jgi:hypothetical protein